jgi:hypothetical protein
MRQNTEHFRAMLKITSDPAQRRVIEKLLLDEEAKLKKHEEDHKKELVAAARPRSALVAQRISMWII